MPRKPKVFIAYTSRMKMPDTPFRRSSGSQLSARVLGNGWPVLLETCHSDAVEVGVVGGSSVVTSAAPSAVKSTGGEAFIAIRSGERSAGMR